MRIYFILNFLYFSLFCLIPNATTQSIDGLVVDKETKQIISDVFIFFENSSIGTITDEKGYFQLESNQAMLGNIIFSHLNYELKSFPTDKLSDTVFLTARHIILEEIVVSKKAKDRKRKKRLKKFENTFLGTKEEKELVKILNPEVLLFEEEKGILIASTNEPLIIENNYLGYKILFYLSTFKLYPNSKLHYEGSAFFESLDGSRREIIQYKRNRIKIYQKGSRCFFTKLIHQKINEEKYTLGYATLNVYGETTNFQTVELDSLDIKQVDSNSYEIYVDGIFSVLHKQINLPVANLQRNGLSANFSSGLKNIKKSEKNIKAISCFITKKHKINVNQYGRIINPLDIEEIGFWAEWRIGRLLPLDFQPLVESDL